MNVSLLNWRVKPVLNTTVLLLLNNPAPPEPRALGSGVSDDQWLVAGSYSTTALVALAYFHSPPSTMILPLRTTADSEMCEVGCGMSARRVQALVAGS